MLEVRLDLVLVPRIGVDHVPAKHRRLEVEENVADEARERKIGDPEVGADDRDGDDDDDGGGEELAAARPLDLLQLGGGLSDESAEAALALPLGAGLALRLADGLDLAPARARAIRGGGSLVVALRLRRVRDGRAISGSRGGVCLPHQRQYFFTSNRSGVFRFDLFVW